MGMSMGLSVGQEEYGMVPGEYVIVKSAVWGRGYGLFECIVTEIAETKEDEDWNVYCCSTTIRLT